MKIRAWVLCIFLFSNTNLLSQNSIKIDGFFDDWTANINTYIDDSLDSQGIDLLQFSICNDDDYLFIRIKLSDEIDLTEQFYNSAKVFINIDADNNSIVVGEKDYLEIKKIKLRELNILGSENEFKDLINIKVRSTGKLLKAKINIKDNSADVEILDKETGISPGQACVFYSKDDVGDKVLGGGWIHKTFNKNLST